MLRIRWSQVLPQSVAELTLVVTIFGVGILVGSGAKPAPADWFGFFGAVIGAAATVAGGIHVLDRERKREGRERRELLISLLNELVDACRPFQVANQDALQARYGRTATQQANEVKSAVSRLHRFREDLRPQTLGMMKVSDAIASLTVDPDLDEAATAAGLYTGADFGHLNAIGHDLVGHANRIRELANDPRM